MLPASEQSISPEACGAVVAVMSGSKLRGTGNFVTLCSGDTPITRYLWTCFSHIANIPVVVGLKSYLVSHAMAPIPRTKIENTTPL